MLVIRLFRTGKKNQPSFKIVITDKRKPVRAGRFVEEVGFLNPVTKEKILKQERIKYWLSVGAKPSPSIYNLLVSEKIIEAKKIPVHKKAKKKKGEQAAASVPAETKVVEEKKPAPETPKEPSFAKASEGEGKKEPSIAPVSAEVTAVEKAKEKKPVPAKVETTSPQETKKVEAPKEAKKIEAPEKKKQIPAPSVPSKASTKKEKK